MSQTTTCHPSSAHTNQFPPHLISNPIPWPSTKIPLSLHIYLQRPPPPTPPRCPSCRSQCLQSRRRPCVQMEGKAVKDLPMWLLWASLHLPPPSPSRNSSQLSIWSPPPRNLRAPAVCTPSYATRTPPRPYRRRSNKIGPPRIRECLK